MSVSIVPKSILRLLRNPLYIQRRALARPSFKEISRTMISEKRDAIIESQKDYLSLYQSFRRSGRQIWVWQYQRDRWAVRQRFADEKSNPLSLLGRHYETRHGMWRKQSDDLAESGHAIVDDRKSANTLRIKFRHYHPDGGRVVIAPYGKSRFRITLTHSES